MNVVDGAGDTALAAWDAVVTLPRRGRGIKSLAYAPAPPIAGALPSPLESVRMDELGQRARGSLRPSTRTAGQTREHSLSLLEPHIGKVAGVPGVPAERRAPKPRGLVD